METITCACKNCAAETGAKYDDYYDDLVPEGQEWTAIEGQWYCPDCSDYVVDPDTGDPICACEIPDLDFGPVYQDARGHYSLARDSEGRLWRLDYDNPKSALPYPVAEEEEE
jgi:rubredoxin